MFEVAPVADAAEVMMIVHDGRHHCASRPIEQRVCQAIHPVLDRRIIPSPLAPNKAIRVDMQCQPPHL